MAVATQKSKPQRFVAHVSAEDKKLLERAAALEGQSLGEFVILYARKAAEQVVQTRQKIQLDAIQSRRFVDALLAPPRSPTPRMKRAVLLHRRTVTESF